MSSAPFLSILVPVYNVEKYLSGCIDSILAQEWTDYELILVDDGSTDDSPGICDAYAQKYDFIHCYHQPNGGLPCARQQGFAHARGRYVTFVDSDDWIDSSMYRLMCGAARDTDADVVCCNYTAVTPQKEIHCCSPFAGGLYDQKQLAEKIYPQMLYYSDGDFFTYGIAPSLCNKLFRRELIGPNLLRVPLSVKLGEDCLASYITLLQASSIYFVEETLYYYRSNSASLTHYMDDKRLLENHTLFDMLLGIIDFSLYPFMERQLDYYIVYQCLLTLAPVFRNIASADAGQLFLAECDYPPVRKAFHAVKIHDVKGLHNKIFTFCIRHRFYRLFRFFLKH